MPPKTGLLLVICATLASFVKSDATRQNVVNANHIFNAIHDSMRQFGSSLNHNGMSIFLATVPKDTELYHGTTHAYRVNGTEWLAFEAEHAIMFARGPMGSPPEDPPNDMEYTRSNSGSRDAVGGLQVVLEDKRKPRPRPHGPGYLHTYRTKHELRLLYVDGQSAAKSSKGTLDVQDYILLEKPPSQDPDEWLPFDDVARAREICSVSETEWEGKIDGVIRMEAGFEMILCNFQKDLDVVQIAQPRTTDDYDESDRAEESFNYYKAISARYDGIGGSRVALDYDHFITLYAHPEEIYFDWDDLPRIDNGSCALPEIRGLVKDLATKNIEHFGVDWQATTDMVVARYAHRIAYLTSGALTNLTMFRAEVNRALRPFIDYSSRNRSAEVERCSQQFLPRSSLKQSLSCRMILSITATICSTLSSVLYDDVEFAAALRRVEDLKQWLRWSEWKKCQGCGYHEICFLAIWPMGSKEDLDSPTCKSSLSNISTGYWFDDFEPPPPRKGHRGAWFKG